MLALARIGHRDDFEFFATVLEDPKEDETTRGYAAHGLGRLGGAAAVRRLDRAMPTVSSTLRQDVIIALGNTGSALAVPVLIQLYANDDDRLFVCGGLEILTHRRLCYGSVRESAAWRRKTLRWWTENSATVPIYGLANCPADPVAPAADVDPAPADEEKAPLGPPGRSLRVYGHFPVADRRDLLFRLRSSRSTVTLPMRMEDAEILLDIPSQLAHTAEDWILVAGTRDRGAPTRNVTAVRVR